MNGFIAVQMRKHENYARDTSVDSNLTTITALKEKEKKAG